MAQKFNIAVQERTVFGKKNRALRDEALIPGVVYGQGEPNINVSIPLGSFQKLFSAAGESSLVDLTVGTGTPFVVLIHDIQRQPVTGDFEHVDFYRVNMKKTLTVTVPFVFDGESPAVKEQGGVLVKALDHATIECLPSALVHELRVDIAVLANINDALHVKDIPMPEGVTVMNDPETVVVAVHPPRKEEEETPVVVADVSTVEVEKKGKTEEAASEEAKVGSGEKK
ncbi:MAG: 50S ribosomal protein L25 [Patescibacteria group bacterium]|jgi:large subunit ribosomal protein L25